MWTRRQLKDNAKKILSKNYWKAFLVTLLLLTITGGGSGSFSGASSGISSFGTVMGRTSRDKKIEETSTEKSGTEDNDGDMNFKVGIGGGKKVNVKVKGGKVYVEDKEVKPGEDGTIEVDGKKINVREHVKETGEVFFKSFLGALKMILVVFGILLLFIAIIGAILTILVLNPLMVGGYNYFNRLHEGTSKFTNLFGGFKKGHYKASVRNMFLKDLYEFLWSLLFIIPGIIKSYSYWMVPYITADNPELSASRAFEISRKTMSGDKWRTFVLQLSFIGWDILASIPFGLGHYFLAPYKQTTYAELYATLKQKAIANGIATEEELTVAA